MQKTSNGTTIELVLGDITNQPDMTAVVNAANAQLTTGGGVAGSIHRSAGPDLYEECKPLAPISPGQAVITKGYNLPNRYVIHTLGPVYGLDEPKKELLASCYINSLKIADEKNIDSIAFPAISTGIFGYPVEEAAEVSLSAVLKIAAELKFVKKVRFVVHSNNDLAVFKKVIYQLF